MVKTFWLLLLLFAPLAGAGQLRVAVASNFAKTLQQLAVVFNRQSGHELLISAASTGQLYAQIKQGAPYDVFLAADTARPGQLVAEGLATDLQVYARGQLVLLVNQQPAADCAAWLTESANGYFAMANPQLAPYGLAAKQFLRQSGLWDAVNQRLVMGENIAQVTHMVISGNARGGLVAAAMLSDIELPEGSCRWNIPLQQYPPVLQAMVVLQGRKNDQLITDFRQFIQSPEAISIMAQHGYLQEQSVD